VPGPVFFTDFLTHSFVNFLVKFLDTVQYITGFGSPSPRFIVYNFLEIFSILSFRSMTTVQYTFDSTLFFLRIIVSFASWSLSRPVVIPVLIAFEECCSSLGRSWLSRCTNYSFNSLIHSLHFFRIKASWGILKTREKS
jgi:hypothetical protein